MGLSQFAVSVLFVLMGAAPARSCTCAITHPQQAFCTSHYVIKASVISPGETDMYQSEERFTNHTLRVMKVFKHPVNNKYLNVNTTRINLYVDNPAKSSCGIWLSTRTKLVLAGRLMMDGQRLHFDICGLRIHWDKLTKQQKKGFYNRYDQNCHCKIRRKNCHTQADCTPSSDNECVWNWMSNAHQECWSDHSVCRTTDKDERCHWMNPKDLRRCLNRRKAYRTPYIPSSP